jgi:hypothetical protein
MVCNESPSSFRSSGVCLVQVEPSFVIALSTARHLRTSASEGTSAEVRLTPVRNTNLTNLSIHTEKQSFTITHGLHIVRS